MRPPSSAVGGGVAGGRSAGLPCGAPASAQAAISAISFVAERRIALEALDADVLLDEPRRHHAGARSHAGAPLDRPRPRTHFFVGDQRHRRDAFRGVAVLTAALEDRRDVLREGDGVCSRSRRLRVCRGRGAEQCGEGHRAGRPDPETPNCQRDSGCSSPPPFRVRRGIYAYSPASSTFAARSALFGQRKRHERRSRRNEHLLPAVEHVGHRRGAPDW